MKKLIKRAFLLAVAAGLILLGAGLVAEMRQPVAIAAGELKGDAARGKTLAALGNCVACHTTEETLKANGPVLGGGRAMKTPFGTFYSPNISRDAERGIGKWSDPDFIRAFREGRSPSGHNYFPAFPYTSFTRATDQDIVDIKAYIWSLPAVATPSRRHEVGFPFNIRFGLTYWKWLYFERGPFKADPAKSAEWNRGAYLVEALGHCGECHTPRDLGGGLVRSRAFSGAPKGEGPDGVAVPNITTHESGIGKWSEADIASFLKSGTTPDGDFTGGKMAEVVLLGTSQLSEADLKAMAVYLKSLKPLERKKGKE